MMHQHSAARPPPGSSTAGQWPQSHVCKTCAAEQAHKCKHAIAAAATRYLLNAFQPDAIRITWKIKLHSPLAVRVHGEDAQARQRRHHTAVVGVHRKRWSGIASRMAAPERVVALGTTSND